MDDDDDRYSFQLLESSNYPVCEPPLQDKEDQCPDLYGRKRLAANGLD